MRLPSFRPLVIALSVLLGFILTAGQAAAATFDDRVDAVLAKWADVAEKVVFFSVPVSGQAIPIVLVLLAGTAIFLTIFFKFINLTGIKAAIGTVRGKYTNRDAPGQITHFQALTAALSATVGLGNIAGVAVAIGIGGPGATFWMILMGLCGMTSKFCECTLGVKYRKIDADGKTYGGAMYYLSDGLKEKGLGGLGRVLAIFFAIMCIGGAVGAGNMFQVNQAAQQFTTAFGIFEGQAWIFGLIVAIITGMVILGGIVSIARVTSFLVPFMCIGYVLAALFIIFTHIGEVPAAFALIFKGAFSPEAMGGGFVGVLIQGIKRGVFSNEAGVGSAPIAHSAVKTDKPASEGLVALLEPFVDTVVVCTMTALVLILTGTWRVNAEAGAEGVTLRDAPAAEAAALGEGAAGDRYQVVGVSEDEAWTEVLALDNADSHAPDEATSWVETASLVSKSGIPITSMAFEEKFKGFRYILAGAVILFAFSTMISWSYYGEQAVIYLFGRNPAVIVGYKIFFCALTVFGASASLDSVIRLSDAMFFAMVVPNLIGLYVLLPVVKRELASYLDHVKSVG